MALFRRRGDGRRGRGPLPEAAREILGLSSRDRVLAWSPLSGGGWAVATSSGLRALLPSGALVNRPWTDVDHAAWDDASRMLAVWWVGTRAPSPLEVEQEDSFLPEVVHERVTASVVTSVEVPVLGGRTVRVALRKAADGTLTTQVVPARGVRMTDPEVRASVDRARARLRDEAGLPPQA